MGVIVLFLSFFVFIFVGSPIALALGGSALIYIVLFANVSPLIVMQQILASVNTYTLSVFHYGWCSDGNRRYF